MKYKEKIADEKKFYDSLSDKEKKELSHDYIERLNNLVELSTQYSYTTENDGVKLDRIGMIISNDEIAEGRSPNFKFEVNEAEECIISEDGITTDDEFIQQSINDIAYGKIINAY